MDQILRFLLSAVLLFGFLQATPVGLSYIKLLRKVKCDEHANFTSPTNVKDHCHSAALTTFKEELKKANTTCTNPVRIDQGMKTLNQIPESSPVTDSSDCSWEGEEFQKPFKNFVKDMIAFVEKLNNMG